MSAFKSTNRPETAHLPANRRAPRASAFSLPASFVAQVISEHQRTASQPQYIRPPRNSAVDAYRAGARITQRRMPAGYGMTASA